MSPELLSKGMENSGGVTMGICDLVIVVKDQLVLVRNQGRVTLLA